MELAMANSVVRDGVRYNKTEFGAHVSKSRPCPACGGTDRCRFYADDESVFCWRPERAPAGVPRRQSRVCQGARFFGRDLPGWSSGPIGAGGARGVGGGAGGKKKPKAEASSTERSEHVREWESQAEYF